MPQFEDDPDLILRYEHKKTQTVLQKIREFGG